MKIGDKVKVVRISDGDPLTEEMHLGREGVVVALSTTPGNELPVGINDPNEPGEIWFAEEELEVIND